MTMEDSSILQPSLNIHFFSKCLKVDYFPYNILQIECRYNRKHLKRNRFAKIILAIATMQLKAIHLDNCRNVKDKLVFLECNILLINAKQ